ncbi:hypothetical protein GF354_00145 [Candidatus Peregrinibacteria bacterium]|nr:hypothetical protein [Candidatus Peregrinibacteria bacterium]
MYQRTEMLIGSEEVADSLNQLLAANRNISDKIRILTAEDSVDDLALQFARKGEVNLQKAVQLAVKIQCSSFLDNRVIENIDFFERMIEMYASALESMNAYGIIGENPIPVPDLKTIINLTANSLSEEQLRFILDMSESTLILQPNLSFDTLLYKLMDSSTPKLEGQQPTYIQMSTRRDYQVKDELSTRGNIVNKWSLVFCEGCDEARSDYFGDLDPYSPPIKSDCIVELNKKWESHGIQGMKSRVYLLLLMQKIIEGKSIDNEKLCIFNEDLHLGEVIEAQYFKRRIDLSQHTALDAYYPEFEGFRPLIELEIPEEEA